MENKTEATTVYWGYIGVMENTTETTMLQGMIVVEEASSMVLQGA